MKYFFALTFGITTLMACDTVNEISTEKLPVVNVIESSQDSSIVSCTVADYIFEDEALTRTNLTPGPEGLSFSWNAERDRIGIFGSSVSLYCSSRITTDDEGKKASFKTDDFSLKTGVAYYAYNDCRSHIENEDNILTLDYTGQRQTGNGTYSHLGEYDFMTASATPAIDNFVDFNFNHVGTVLLVQCKIPATDTYKSISIRTSNKLFVTKGTMNLREDLGLITATENSNTMTLLLGEKNTNGVSMTKDEPFDAYFTIAPIDLSEETLTIILTSATGSTYVSTMGGRNLERGKAYKKECWYLKKMSTLYTGTDRHSESEMFRTLLKRACNFIGVPAPAVLIDGGDNVISQKYTNEQGHTITNHQPSFWMQEVYDDVSYAMNGVNDYNLILSFATHDNGCENPYNDVFSSGPQKHDGYYTYCITGSQMCETEQAVGDYIESYRIQDYYFDKNGKTADEAVSKFNTWVNSLSDHLPIVVLSHIPMHEHRGDCYGGRIWLDALNAAADKHDIIFLWGHNHTIEDPATKQNEDNQYDETKFVNYCLKPKDFINVQDKSTQQEVDTKPSIKHYVGPLELKFHYLNAGYIIWGYSSIFTFIDDDNNNKYDRVVFRKYDTEGNYTKGNLGNETINNLKLEPYTITLTKK